MDLLPPLGTQIDDVFAPTHAIYGELLAQNSKAIKSTPIQSFAYGPHPRHRLDVYYPSPSPVTSSLKAANKDETYDQNKSDSPVLIFIHGGGLYGGDKILATIPDGLAHANIGHFFAFNYGYTVIVPNYRLVFQDAAFPSGGEDVSLLLDWVYANMQPRNSTPNNSNNNNNSLTSKPRDLILMGHSAGGIHQNTYLFAPEFAAHRSKTIYSSPSTPDSIPATTHNLTLRAVVNLCVPVDIKPNGLFRLDVIETYFGLDGLTATHNPRNPLSLIKSANPQELKTLFSQVRFLITTAQYDPPEFVIDANTELFDVLNGFAAQALENKTKSEGIVRREILPGHNHISPPVSLGTGIAREEEWGHKVAAFVSDVLNK